MNALFKIFYHRAFRFASSFRFFKERQLKKKAFRLPSFDYNFKWLI